MSDNVSHNDDVIKPMKGVVNIKNPSVKKKIFHSFQEISKIDWVDIPDTNKKLNPDYVISPVEIIEDEPLSENINTSFEDIKEDELIDESNYVTYLNSESRDNWVGDKY